MPGTIQTPVKDLNAVEDAKKKLLCAPGVFFFFASSTV
jgi:hypothetical protein